MLALLTGQRAAFGLPGSGQKDSSRNESIVTGAGACLAQNMPGASELTQPVKIINANWVAGPDADDGRFEVLFITEDDEWHVASPSPAAMTALIALTQAGTVMLWDPAVRTLIAANVVGTMPWTERDR